MKGNSPAASACAVSSEPIGPIDKLELADLVRGLFHGRAEVIAVEKQDGTFAPRDVPDGITTDTIATHLAGRVCYGFYILDENSCCFASCIDIDNKPDKPNPQWREQVLAVYLALTSIGLRPSPPRTFGQKRLFSPSKHGQEAISDSQVEAT